MQLLLCRDREKCLLNIECKSSLSVSVVKRGPKDPLLVFEAGSRPASYLSTDWLIKVTWPVYWNLIGRDRSRDLGGFVTRALIGPESRRFVGWTNHRRAHIRPELGRPESSSLECRQWAWTHCPALLKSLTPNFSLTSTNNVNPIIMRECISIHVGQVNILILSVILKKPRIMTTNGKLSKSLPPACLTCWISVMKFLRLYSSVSRHKVLSGQVFLEKWWLNYLWF